MAGVLRFSNLPNAITIMRLLLAPLAAWAIGAERWGEALGLFVAAGVSDGIDGKLARKYGVESDFGAMLDPIADKALMILSIWTLTWLGLLPLWFAALVSARDVAVLAGAWLLHARGARGRVRPLFISKLNTAAQIALIGLVLTALALGWPLSPALDWGLWAAAGLSVASFLAYAARWKDGEAWPS